MVGLPGYLGLRLRFPSYLLLLALENFCLTLEITEHKGKHFYFFLDGDKPVLVTSAVSIYDEANGEYGYFDGLVLNFGTAQEPSSKTSEHGESSSKKHGEPSKKHRR